MQFLKRGFDKLFNFQKALSLLLVMVILIAVPCVSGAQEIRLYSIGNDVTNTKVFNNGIFTAISEGSGLFAIALYSEDELKKINFVQSEVELEEYRVNMVIDNAENYTMKVFRFDENSNPLCINSSLSPISDDTCVYINETFDDGIRANGAKVNGSTTILSDGMVKIIDRSSTGIRYGTFSVPYTEKHVIFEADYMLPSDGACENAYLLATYYDDNYHPIVYLHPNGLKDSIAGDSPVIYPRSSMPKGVKFNIAVKFDLENKNYDIYYNRAKITNSPVSIKNKMSMTNPTGGFSFYAPMVINNEVGSDIIFVDNIRVYSGTEFKDIGNKIPNVHRYDFKENPAWETKIYERPEAEELAKKAFEAGHPRIIINKSEVDRIKNSLDDTIASIRKSVIAMADTYVEAEPYTYKYSTAGSIENIGDALNMIMHLGMAYQLTGNTIYSDRAYKEAEILFYVPSKDYWSNTGDNRDFWNSYSFLDVAEISTIMAICYDWMYDAWTPEQKHELEKHTLDKGILRAYRGVFGEYNPTYSDGKAQMTFDFSNNWGAVCNGGMLMAAIAFMEADAHMCSQIAEAHIRALEHFLPSYAPSGAWEEGASYWAYALKYLTMACSTLESISGTDYGICKTPGLRESQLFALSCEGKTGVVGFGDVGSGHINAPFMFYWANKYKDSQIGGARIYSMSKFGFNYNVYDLIYYNPDYVDLDYIHPLTSYYKGAEIVTMSAGYDSTDAFVAVSGGKGITSHGHLDSGGVIIDKNGLRVLCDSGAEHYAAEDYFSSNRYWYYKARPEGHNLFVINPQNITAADEDRNETTLYYHGQDSGAFSEITEYSPENKTASIDLSDAYSRDASEAVRTVSIAGQDVVVEDNIELLDDASVPSDGSLIEWYWHFKDKASAVIGDTTYYSDEKYCDYSINEDKKSVTLTFRDYTYQNNNFCFSGTSKSFTLTFESNCDFELEIRDAVRNEYDAEKIKELQAAGAFSTDYYCSTNAASKVVVKIKNAKGNINMKMILK